MSLLANSNAIETGGYLIQRSLRFRSSASAYLDRTLTTPTNNKIYTWSGWVKKGIIGTANRKVLFSARNGTNEDYFCYDDTNDNLRFFINSTNASTTSAVYRDASAWYHVVLVVDTTQATAANRVSIYVNGTLAANANGTAPTQNSNTTMNGAYRHIHGRCDYNTAWYFDGYLAEVNFIDGQALTPSSFGQTDAVTGVWVPKKYTGTYGTNGFYLPFSDNTSATTLAYDKSGNSNNWTPNNISTTAGATYDSMTDVPTLTSATAANYCVLNPLNTGDNTTFADANLKVTLGATSQGRTAVGSVSMKTGKWYWEVTGLANITSDRALVGITADYANITGSVVIGYQSYSYAYTLLGDKLNNSVGTAYGATYTNNDVIGVALNMDNGELTFYKNGVSQGVAFTVDTTIGYVAAVCGTSATQPQYAINFGQRPFSYTPPTGFKALNTFNLPDPTIKKPNQYMDATLYVGNAGTQTITNSGGFQPDLLWAKDRSTASNHRLVDSVRGVSKLLYSSLTNAEGTDATGVTSFNSNGFSIGATQINDSGSNYVGWQWKKGATPGFDIVTYTGNGTSQNISHSLGVAPKMIIVKSRSQVVNWLVWHASLTTPSTAYLLLNLTDAQANTPTTVWNSTVPTSTVFSVGSNTSVNNNTSTYVAYLFAEIAGFSKFGSYTGNGSTDGPFVYCGFRPKYVMIKVSSGTTESWTINDAARNTYNVTDSILYPNLSDAEGVGSGAYIDFTSNGFKIRNSNPRNNGSGYTYIYAAFAENPFKYSLAR